MIKQNILDRLSEPSTYAGLAVLVALFGVNQEDWRAWSEGLAGLFAVVAMMARENRVPAPNKKRPMERTHPYGDDE